MPSAILPNYMPPVVIGPSTKKATRPTNKIPELLIQEARKCEREVFDAQKHVNFQPPSKIYSMKDIGLEGRGISPNAASEPFSLFTEEAIRQMRAEIFSEDVLENCQYASTFNKNMVRGMTTVRAPFVYDAWRSKEVLAKVSEVAGIELVPAIDFDIGNINISINDQVSTLDTNAKVGDDDMTAVAWHYDSFPFVCVIMLSDCTGMIGGETAIKLPDGSIKKIRGPSMGTAVILQGRYIEHQALKAFGGRERITMVTSFRPKSPFIKDETVLTGVRGISNLSDIYSQYTEYRLEILEERIRHRLKAERQRELARRSLDIKGLRRFLAEQQRFLEAMLDEIYEVED